MPARLCPSYVASANFASPRRRRAAWSYWLRRGARSAIPTSTFAIRDACPAFDAAWKAATRCAPGLAEIVGQIPARSRFLIAVASPDQRGGLHHGQLCQ
jgi:hypothetical protein